MKLALSLIALLSLATPAQAKDAPTAIRVGWVDSAKLDAGSTELARFKSHLALAATADQAQQIRTQGNHDVQSHLRDACAKVKAEKHLSMVVSDPLAADPADEVTAEVLKLWNAADEAGVAQENARLTAKVAALEKAAQVKPTAPSIPPPPPPIQPAKVAKK